MVSEKETPGSRLAKLKGCRCPVIDNGYGQGYMGGVRDEHGNAVFVINETCMLHARKPKDQEEYDGRDE